jgi:hypothetical protein
VVVLASRGVVQKADNRPSYKIYSLVRSLTLLTLP